MKFLKKESTKIKFEIIKPIERIVGRDLINFTKN